VLSGATFVEMRLTVVWHKLFWPSAHSPTGFAAHGGLVRQIDALSSVFDSTRVVGPCSRSGERKGDRAITGKDLSIVSLTSLPKSPWLTWLMLPFWFVRNGFTLTREISQADAVFPLLPSPVGTLGLLLALAMRKPLLVRPMNTWAERRFLWRLERALLERIAGGRNVVFATGESDRPPSPRNPAIRWIFSTTVSEAELEATRAPRVLSPGRARLIIVGRQLETDATAIVLRSLPKLVHEFPHVAVDVIGHGAELSELEQLADDLHVGDRVTFHGAATHERVLELLRQADLFCLPATETESLRQSVHEGLACGLPVVTTPSSLGQMMNGCGLTLQSGTSDALADAVRACLRDPDGYHRMSIAALRAAQCYSLERWSDTVRAALVDSWGPLQSDRSASNHVMSLQKC